MTFVIGLTGGIGSGKSTVAKHFAMLGVPVFDTDSIAKELVNPGSAALQELAAKLGDEIITINGELDRKTLKRRMFECDQTRDLVEQILHPKIRLQLLARIKSCNAPYCIAVIPLLVEKNWLDLVDRVLVVDLPEEIQLSRATMRDNVSKEFIHQIMQTQVSRETRLKIADDIIDNSQNLEFSISQVKKLHDQYMAQARKP